SVCPACDANGDGTVTADEVNIAQQNSLNGCAPPPPSVCGNGILEAGEDCDDGGTCIGGSNAGTHCTAETDCSGAGVCIGGAHAETACTDNSGCTGGQCVHCVPQGGDGCAANCTAESDVPFSLVPGVLTPDGTGLEPQTSGVVIHGDTLTIPL